MKNSKSRLGFTLVEIMIVVAIIGLLAAIAIPNFVRARTSSQTNACINNLRQIDSVKQQWALENKQVPTVTPGTSDIQPYLGRGTGGSIPWCPLDSTATFTTSYTMNDVQTPPYCNVGGSTAAGGITNHILP